MEDGEGAFFVSLNGAIAEVPTKSDKSWPRLSLTTGRDVGKFVAASLDLPRWKQDMNIMGDTLSFGELIAEAERITGKAFAVKRWEENSLDMELAALQGNDVAPWRRLGLEFKKSYCRDEEGLGWSYPTVNQMDVSSRSSYPGLRLFWKGGGARLTSSEMPQLHSLKSGHSFSDGCGGLSWANAMTGLSRYC